MIGMAHRICTGGAAMKSGGGSASLSSPSGTGSPMPQISFMPAGTAQIPSVEMPSAPADGGISI